MGAVGNPILWSKPGVSEDFQLTDMRAGHWDQVYTTKAEDSVSWFE